MKSNEKFDELAENLAGALIQAIEDNPGEWSKSWTGGGIAAYPHNVTTGKAYTGGNVFMLWLTASAAGYGSGQWATYKQYEAAGHQVRKGEKGTRLMRWNVIYTCDAMKKSHSKPCGPQCRKRIIPTTFTVFNSAQVDGDVADAPGFSTEAGAPLPGAEEVRAFFGSVGARWTEEAQDRAYYSPGEDRIVTPTAEQFDTVGGFAATVAHEFTHWTGSADRLGREQSGGFGSESYALEELVAELGAVVLCNALGLEHQPLETHAAYLKNWLQALKSEEGPKLLWKVAGQASKAASYITEAAEARQTVAA